MSEKTCNCEHYRLVIADLKKVNAALAKENKKNADQLCAFQGLVAARDREIERWETRMDRLLAALPTQLRTA